MSQSVDDATQDLTSAGRYGIHGMPVGRLEGACGACTGAGTAKMPNGANLRGFALIVLYFQVPHVCSLPESACQSSDTLLPFLHLPHPHKTGKPSKTCASLVIQTVFGSVYCYSLADFLALFI